MAMSGGTAKKLIIGHSVRPTPINPLANASTISANVSELIFDSLIEMDQSEKMRPALAKRWEISPDGRVWTFWLRDNVVFHDGRRFTANDVVATYNVMRKLKKGFLSLGLSNIESVEALDEKTVRFKVKRYDSFLPEYFHLIRIVSADDIIRNADGAITVGTGPFSLESFSDKSIALKAFDKHFRGRPKLDRIEVKILPSQRACLSRLIAGQIDMVMVEDSADLRSILGVPDIDLIDTGMSFIYMMILNQKSPHLKDPNLRKALNYGLDRDYLRKRIRQMEGEIAEVASYTWSPSNHDARAFQYKPKYAKGLFLKAGYVDRDGDHKLDRDGKAYLFEIAFATGSTLVAKILNITKLAYENIGVEVNIDAYDPEELFRKFYSRKGFDAVVIPIASQCYQSVQYLLWHSKQRDTNVSSYSNSRADELLDDIRYSRAVNTKNAAKIELAKVMADDPPGIPLFIKQTKVLVNDRFQGFTKDSHRFFPLLRNVWVEEKKDK